MALPQEVLDLRLYLIHLLRTRYLYVDRMYMGDRKHALLRRRQRNVDHIVLILADGLPLGCRDTDDLERLVVDADVLSDGILRTEQVRRDGRSDHGDAAALIHIAGRNERPVFHLQRTNLHKFGRDPLHRSIPVQITIDNLIRGRNRGGNVVDAFDLALNRLGIIILQRFA